MLDGVKNMNIFGDRLKEQRKEKHVTQQVVADHLGLTCRAYQYYEGGKGFPDYHGLLALAEYFGVSIDYLVGRTENPEVNQ